MQTEVLVNVTRHNGTDAGDVCDLSVEVRRGGEWVESVWRIPHASHDPAAVVAALREYADSIEKMTEHLPRT
jgi:hypothetical protein